jgi:hypothetical protein
MKKVLALSLLFAVVAAWLILRGTRPPNEELEINRLGGFAAYRGGSQSSLSSWLENQVGSRFLSEPYEWVEFRFDTLTDDDFTGLKLVGVKNLSLECPRLTIRSARHISTLTDLEELYIATANVDDEYVAEIAKLKKLKMLNVSNSQVSDRSTAALKSMPNLKTLAVARTQMTNGALLEVVDAPALEYLSISPDQWSQELYAKCRSTTPWRAQLVDLHIYRE